jgi:transposase
MYQYYLGVDLHRKRTYVVLMDSQGAICDQRRMTNAAMTDYVARLPANTFAVLAAKLDTVVLAHPKRVRAIAAARIKTDRIDATIWAHLARADLLPIAYAPPVEVRELRELVRHRAKRVRERTRHKNRVHRVLAQSNIQRHVVICSGNGAACFSPKCVTVYRPLHNCCWKIIST